MAEVTNEKVLEALSGIVDEESDRSIVSAGMISGLVVKDGHVQFAIEVDPEHAAEYEPLRQAAEKIVDEIPGVLSVTAILTAHQSGSAPAQGQPRPQAQPQAQQGQAEARPAPMPGVRSIVAVASGKGGVGKSTVSINLAAALAVSGLKVGMLDADIYGPSMPRMMGISGRPDSPDGQNLMPMRNFGIKCMSIGFLVEEETPMIWRGPMVMSALEQMMSQVAWGELDIMVVDMPPGTGDAQLTMAQRVPLTGAVIVSTPQDIALIDARKGLNMFRKVDVPVLGIVENMSTFHCPNCGHETQIFGHGGARSEAERLGIDFLGEVPLELAIRETSDSGRPIVIAQPDSPHAATFRAIADRVWANVEARLAGNEGRAAPKIVVQ